MLGVVTEATLRLLPLPPARAVLSAAFRRFDEAAAMVQRVFRAGFLPAALEVADSFTLEAARKFCGSAVVPSGEGHLLIELDGQPGSVRSEVRALSALIRESGCLHLQTAFGEGPCEKLWELRRRFSASLKGTGLVKLNEDIVVPRSRLVDLAEFAAGLRKKHGFPVACFGHAGDGNIHVNVMAAGDHWRARHWNRQAALVEPSGAGGESTIARRAESRARPSRSGESRQVRQVIGPSSG
jgi:FAD/FMN-containing dehydrogenase